MLEQMPHMTSDLGAVQWSVSLLVPTGRGKAADMISPQEHEHVFHWRYDLSKQSPFDIKSTAAPEPMPTPLPATIWPRTCRASMNRERMADGSFQRMADLCAPRW